MRKRAGKTRSAVVQEALRGWIESQREIEKIRLYEEGYRRRSETAEEINVSTAMAVEPFSSSNW